MDPKLCKTSLSSSNLTAALIDDNASARAFAHALSEEELFHESQRRYVPMFSYPPDRPVVFVKYGGPDKQAEGDMQRHAFGWLSTERQRTQCNIYVPEVYKIFSKRGLTFIIMQFIEARGIQGLAREVGAQQWEDLKAPYYDLIVGGLQLLRRMPLPGHPTPGPHTSSRRIIKHMLFKDREAPVEYDTIEELQDHLNRVARLGYRNNPNPPVVNFEKELVFCYTDFNDENFMFTTDADHRLRLYIIDFEHASFLPIGFLAYAVFQPNPRWFLCPWIGERIGSSLPRDNLEVMKRIFYMFQISTWRIGLSEGQVVSVQSRIINPIPDSL